MKDSHLKHTIGETIDAFRHFASNRSGRVNVDSSWSSRLIYFYLDMYRYREEYMWTIEKGNLITNEVWDQELDVLPCVELVLADMAECPCAPASGCVFMKSKHPIPELIINKNTMMVTDILGSETFDFVKWTNFSSKINSRKKAQATAPYFTIKKVDDELYLYVYNKEFLSCAAMTARFLDPIEVLRFPKCNQEVPDVINCSILDQPFNISAELKPSVFEKTFEILVRMRSSNQGDDIINDNEDDTASPPILR